MPTFYSQFGEDAWLFDNSFISNNGTYVDIGCAHPFDASNTAFLRELGWSGVAIDAGICWKSMWSDISGCEFILGVVSDGCDKYFTHDQEHPMNSRISECGIATNTIKLSDVVKFNPNVASLDVEGHEFDAWISGGPQFKPDIVIFEFNTCGVLSDKLLNHLLPDYDLLHTTYANHIMKRKCLFQ